MHLANNTLLQGGKYRIVRFISSGGFGCTYEAEHVMLHKKVAIKEFFVKDFCNRDETTSQVSVGITSKTALVDKLKGKFIEEAQSLCTLDHSNIVHVSDVFEENGTAYYVMDYIKGPSLNDLVKRDGSMDERRAVGYIKQIAEALEYVHSRNRLHLDIKPGNIMVDENDKAVLIDFGASKQYDEEGGENTSTLLGKTPGYAPLEQMGNDVVKFLPSTDIYALGATLYKLLTGVTPPSASLLASGEELGDMPSTISASTRDAIIAAMQTNKMKRPQSVEDFLKLLLSDVSSSSSADDEDDHTILDEEPVKPARKPKGQKVNKQTRQETTSKGSVKKEKISTNPDSKPDKPKSRKKKFNRNYIIGAVIVLFILFIISLAGGSDTEPDDSNNKTETVTGHHAADRVVNQKFKDSNGETYSYTGEVQNGLPNGLGEGVYSFGRYVGPYKDGLMHGSDGKFTEQGGAIFVGSFAKDYYYEGTLTRTDGTYFVGRMKDGVPYKGTEYDRHGNITKQL